MDQKDQIKVIKAGFQIIRKDDYPTIRIKSKNIKFFNAWKTVFKYETKAERDRHFEDMLKSPKVIAD